MKTFFKAGFDSIAISWMIFSLGVCAELITSCSPFLEMSSQITEKDQAHNSKIRSLNEAIDIAEKSLIDFDVSTKSSNSFRIIDRSDIKVLYGPAVKSQSQYDTLVYAINFQNNSGFALVAANREAPEVLVLTESGNFDGKQTQSPAFNIYMDKLLTELSQNYTSQQARSSEYDEMVFNRIDTTITITTYGDTLVSNWHKFSPYNDYCTISSDIKTDAGSGPVAIAKIIASFEYPSSISLTFPASPMNVLSLDWNQMNNQSVSLLVRELGERSNTVYSSTNVSTPISNIQACLQSIGYQSTYIQDTNSDDSYEQIDGTDKILVYFKDEMKSGGGTSVQEDEIVICDGGKTEILKYKYYQRRQNETIWKNVGWEELEYSYNHYTMAYPNGEYNGYYIVKSLRKSGEGGRLLEPTEIRVEFQVKSTSALINIKPSHL